VTAGRVAATLLAAALAGPAAAQSEGSVVAALPGSPRAQAMADAAVALVGDAASLFANPAGIATVRRWAVEGAFESHLEGARYSTAAFAARFGRLTWGVGAQAFTFGDEPEIVGGTPTGATFTAADLLAAGTLVYRFSLIAVGASAKYARQSVADWSAAGWAADVGVAMAVFDIAALGFAVQNLGGDLDADAGLPTRTRLGMSFNLTDPEGTVRALTSVEGRWTEGAPDAFHAGFEAGVVTAGVGLLGRAGYATPGDGRDGSRWSVGAGVLLGRFRVDYAYRDFDVLGTATHRLGVRWKP
jgi:hypothetical protein